MNRRISILITVLFIVIMSIVGIVQAIAELKSGETIQILDVLEDTFITPVKNKNTIAHTYDTLNNLLTDFEKQIEKLKNARGDKSQLWSDLEESVEEIIFTVSDIKKTFVSVNRHRQVKKEVKFIKVVDSISGLLNILNEKILDQTEPKEIQNTYQELSSFTSSNSKLFNKASIFAYPFMTIKHFIFYTIFNREYLRKYENELEETSVFANTLRPYMQFFRYNVLRDWGGKALAGRNGWLFYKQGVDYLLRPNITDSRAKVVDPEDKPILESAIDSIVAFQNELKKLNISMVVVIVPGKASIYPDMLSKRVKPDKSGKLGHSLEILRELNKRNIATIDLFTPLSEARKDDATYGDSLYLSQDTHWNKRGVRVVAQTVANWVKSQPVARELTGSVEYILDTVPVIREGDIQSMANLPNFSLGPFRVPLVKQPTEAYQVYQVTRDSLGAITSKRLFRDDFKRSKILVLGDSFSRIYQTDEPRSAGWISHLAYELSEPICSIVSDGGASTLVREKLVRKVNVLKGKKLVIWEFVERDLRYGAEGWKDLKLTKK